ncbi:MAG: ABC-2 family transporter protein [Oscillospiraceae bacterium]|nr:ABC-2 family transporter protein [Oscillospiraceae bacterium]
MSKVRRFMRIHMPFARAGLQSTITYRTNFICYVLGDVLNSFIMFFLWVAVYKASGTGIMSGFTETEMILYIFVSFITSYLNHSSGAWELTEEIRDGSIAMRIIRPIDFERPYLFFELGDKIMAMYIVAVPAFVGIEIYRFVVTGLFQFNIINFLAFMFSIALGYLLNFYIGISFAFIAFVTKYMWGLQMVKECIIGFLSGGMIPLNFLPAGLAEVLKMLPFASLTYTPTMIYMGKYSLNETLLFMFMQVVWLLAFYALSKIIWRAVQNNLTVQGG